MHTGRPEMQKHCFKYCGDRCNCQRAPRYRQRNCWVSEEMKENIAVYEAAKKEQYGE